jgi:hypothetical protein
MFLEISENTKHILAALTPIVVMVALVGYNYIVFLIGQKKRQAQN